MFWVISSLALNQPRSISEIKPQLPFQLQPAFSTSTSTGVAPMIDFILNWFHSQLQFQKLTLVSRWSLNIVRRCALTQAELRSISFQIHLHKTSYIEYSGDAFKLRIRPSATSSLKLVSRWRPRFTSIVRRLCIDSGGAPLDLLQLRFLLLSTFHSGETGNFQLQSSSAPFSIA